MAANRSDMPTQMPTPNEIKLANENAALLRHLAALLAEYAAVCDEFCKRPERNAVYREAKAVFK